MGRGGREELRGYTITLLLWVLLEAKWEYMIHELPNIENREDTSAVLELIALVLSSGMPIFCIPCTPKLRKKMFYKWFEMEDWAAEFGGEKREAGRGEMGEAKRKYRNLREGIWVIGLIF
jgi:hypothetical protein